MIPLASLIPHVALEPYFSFSSSPKSTTRNSLRAHSTTLSTKPGKYPPPTIIPSLHVRPCHSSSNANSTHIAPFAGTMYFPTNSAISSERYGTGLHSCFASADAGTFHPYPPFFCVLSSDVLIMPILTGGSGKKYSVYALARKLVIAKRLGKKAERLVRSGR
jgi:hypothetical protein